MKTQTIEYEQVGHVVMLTSDDWRIIVEWLSKHGVQVTEGRVNTRGRKPGQRRISMTDSRRAAALARPTASKVSSR